MLVMLANLLLCIKIYVNPICEGYSLLCSVAHAKIVKM